MRIVRPTRIMTFLTAGLLAAAMVGAVPIAASADSRPADPTNPATPTTVSADALPTAQVSGVVWQQVVVGDTVYAVGKFTRARPAGVAAGGQGEVERDNILAYSISTGQLTSFAPSLDAQALAVAASPDGTRLYVAGDFSKVGSQPAYKFAAFDLTKGGTGTLVPGFSPVFNAQARSIAVTSSGNVFVGGIFTGVSSTPGGTSQPRADLVQLAPDGSVTSWRADADASVDALTLTADGSKLVVGGRFTHLAGSDVYGLGAVDPSSGALLPWAANTTVRNAGTKASITSLTATADGVFGTGYVFGGGGDLEGSFRANPSTGDIVWLESCHGDSYSSFPTASELYVVGHPHYCGNVPGGFPQTNPWQFHRAVAFSLAAVGTNGAEPYTSSGYHDFSGVPAPELLHWFPDLKAGTVTGQGQAAWSVTGDSRYVVLGGEFPSVNGTAQQGLVRFAVPTVAPDKLGPMPFSTLLPAVTSYRPGEVRVSWQPTWDYDNEDITYSVYRSDDMSKPIRTVTVPSDFAHRDRVGFVDTGLTVGKKYYYQIIPTDPFGNTISTGARPVTVSATDQTTPYESAVLADSPSSFWPLGDITADSSSKTGYDHAGYDVLTAASGTSQGSDGPFAGSGSTVFDGSGSGYAADGDFQVAPTTLSIEAWVKTQSTAGGKIVGFGDKPDDTSDSYDRQIWMSNDGTLSFGTYDGATHVISSGSGLNDGKWHQVTATLSAGGSALYVDGTRVASSGVTSAQYYAGYWHIGGDHLANWSPTASSANFAGSIADVAIYPAALTGSQVQSHYAASTRTNRSPSASFTASTSGLTASTDASASSDPDGTITSYAWDFGDGAKATGRTASHAYTTAGAYTIALTVTDDQGATATTTRQITVSSPNRAPTASFTQATSGLSVSTDGSASSDPDGTVASYAWAFGDGATAAGRTATHAYGAGGTYTVTLTVTDDRGATGTATKQVTVSAPTTPGTLASDSFSRSVTSGWGSADSGGAWKTGTPAWFAVNGSAGTVATSPGTSQTITLPGVSAASTDTLATAGLSSQPTGGGFFAGVIGRQVGSSSYVGRVWIPSSGAVQVQLLVNGTQVKVANVAGLVYSPGMRLGIRFDVVGTSPTTLSLRAWNAAGAEPAAWQVTTTDSTAALQAAGTIGFTSYLSGSATASPVLSWDDLKVTPAK